MRPVFVLCIYLCLLHSVNDHIKHSFSKSEMLALKVKQLLLLLLSQPVNGSPRPRAVKDRAAACEPADQPTDTDAQHGGLYNLS